MSIDAVVDSSIPARGNDNIFFILTLWKCLENWVKTEERIVLTLGSFLRRWYAGKIINPFVDYYMYVEFLPDSSERTDFWAGNSFL